MPVRVKNSTTGAGSDSGKKPVCVQAPLLLKFACTQQVSGFGASSAVKY